MMAPNAARKLLSRVLSTGSVFWSGHAEREMEADNLNKNDVLNVLRGGHITEPAELEHGSWRYRVPTARIYVAVAFPSDASAVVVTAWRVRR
ncbi:MAG: DUF4258 domain-containing protein [Deltaproteobacteria bacterium]|nr:DUF4258 domain-containing protein [Deltaproteobacteria bacterium]